MGVDEVPGTSCSAQKERFVEEDFIFASSVSSSRIRCWLEASATGYVGGQDCMSCATSLAICLVASFCGMFWPELRDLWAARRSKSMFLERS